MPPIRAFSARIIYLYEFLILEVHFLDDRQHRVVYAAFLVFVEIFCVDGFAVFDDDMGLFDLRQMGFPDLICVVDAYGYDGTAGFLCDLKAAAVERQKRVRLGAAASFGEDTDGDAGFYFFHCGENGFHALLDIISVKKETVQVFHPV